MAVSPAQGSATHCTSAPGHAGSGSVVNSARQLQPPQKSENDRQSASVAHWSCVVPGTSGTHTHNCGDQWKPRIHSSVSTHGCRGAHTCCGQVPPGCTQTLQVSLQQTSLPRHSTSPHGTTPAGHSRRQLCGQIWPGAQVAHTVRQPLCAAICEMRVPATAPPPSSGEPHPMSCAANTINPADTNARRFKIEPPPTANCSLSSTIELDQKATRFA